MPGHGLDLEARCWQAIAQPRRRPSSRARLRGRRGALRRCMGWRASRWATEICQERSRCCCGRSRGGMIGRHSGCWPWCMPEWEGWRTQWNICLRGRSYSPSMRSPIALAQVYSQMGRMQDAIREQKTVVTLVRGLADDWNDLGVMEAQAGDKAAARRDLEHALQLEPGNKAAQANLRRL